MKTRNTQRANAGQIARTLPTEIIIQMILPRLSSKDTAALINTGHYFQKIITPELYSSRNILAILATTPTMEMARFIHNVLRPTDKTAYKNIEYRANAKEASPQDTLCFALVTNNIYELNKTNIWDTLKWLEKDENKKYARFTLALEAISNLINKTGGLSLIEIFSRKNDDTDFSYFNLASADFVTTPLSKKNKFLSLDLTGANLEKVNLDHFELKDCYMEEANLEDARLTYVDFDNCTMDNVCAIGADFSGSSFSHSCLNGASLEHSNFNHTYFPGSDCTFNDATLDRAILAPSILKSIRLPLRNIQKSVFIQDDALRSVTGLNKLFNGIDAAIKYWHHIDRVSYRAEIKLLQNARKCARTEDIANAMKASIATAKNKAKLRRQRLIKLQNLMAKHLIQQLQHNNIKLCDSDKLALLNAARKHVLFAELDKTTGRHKAFTTFFGHLQRTPSQRKLDAAHQHLLEQMQRSIPEQKP